MTCRKSLLLFLLVLCLVPLPAEPSSIEQALLELDNLEASLNRQSETIDNLENSLLMQKFWSANLERSLIEAQDLSARQSQNLSQAKAAWQRSALFLKLSVILNVALAGSMVTVLLLR